MHEVEETGAGWGCLGAILFARALETSRAEALHDLDRNSIGTLGLSGRGVPPLGTNSGSRQLIVLHFGSMSLRSGVSCCCCLLCRLASIELNV